MRLPSSAGCASPRATNSIAPLPRRVPPAMLTGPPKARARTSCRASVDCVNATVPCACTSGGRSRASTTSLAASSYSPATLVARRSVSGTSSLSRSRPSPLALIAPVKRPALSRNGEACRNCRNRAVAPCACPLTSTRGARGLRSGMLTFTSFSAAPRMLPLLPAMSMRLRWKLSSASMSSMRGQPGAYSSTPLRTRAVAENSPCAGSTNGNALRSPFRRSSTFVASPARMPLTSHSRGFTPISTPSGR